MHVNSTRESVSAMIVTDGRVSIASADNLFDGRWWISRVNVQGTTLGKGVGTALLKKLIEEVLSYGPANIIVAPGGYHEDTNRQFNFYKKNGFVETEEEGLLIYKNG